MSWMDGKKDDIKKVSEILNSLTPGEKDTLYCLIRAEHVREDVESQLEGYNGSSDNFNVLQGLNDEDYNNLTSKIANRYVSGEYDGNFSYWENIDILIEEELGALTECEEKDI